MYSGRSRNAALSNSNSPISPSLDSPPNPCLVRPGTQFGCGMLTSRVDSIETIFICQGIKIHIALRVVVFPEAVPPTKSIGTSFWKAIQRYATINEDMVRNATISAGENGSSLNRRIQNAEPRVETSRPSFITIREPSISVASSSGSATEMCLPQRCASLITYDSSASSVSHTQVVSTDSNFR